MKKRRFLITAAAINAAVIALLAIGAWRWVEWRTKSSGQAATVVKAQADENGALPTVRPIELIEAEVAPRNDDDFPAVWLTFNEAVEPDEITPFITFNHCLGPLKVVVEGHSPDKKRVLCRLNLSDISGQVKVNLKGGIEPLRLSSNITFSIPDQMALLRFEVDSPATGNSTISAIFSRLPKCKGAADFIKVEPEVPFTVHPYDAWGYRYGLSLYGAFEAGQVYTVTIEAGLTTDKGSSVDDVLRKRVVRKVQIPDRQPLFTLADSGRYLSPHGRMVVRAQSVNVSQCKVKLSRVLPNNAVFFGLREEDVLPYHYGWRVGSAVAGLEESLGEYKLNIDIERNKLEEFDIDLRQVAPGIGAGIYLLQLSDDYNREERIVVISDLGVSLRLSERELAAWVIGMAEGNPLDNAEVTLWSVKNREMATAHSGEDGTCKLTWQIDEEPFAVTVVRGEDRTYIPLNSTHGVSIQEKGGGRFFNAGDCDALLNTDRGVYRPGETIHLHALVRDSLLRAPQPFPVVARLKKPDRRTLSEIGVTLDDYGVVTNSFILPDSAPTGEYTLEVTLPGKKGAELGRTTLRVEDFAPPQLTVAVSGVPDNAAAEAHVVTVKSDYLFGRPGAGLEVALEVFFEDLAYTPQGWRGWVFGDKRRSFTAESIRLAAQRLDDGGYARFDVKPDPNWRPPAALRERVTATVLDSAGRPVSRHSEGIVHVYPHYVGLRASGGCDVEVAQEFGVDVALVKSDGTPLRLEQADDFEIILVREVWRPLIERNKKGRFNYSMVCESEEVEGDAPEFVIDGGLGRVKVSLPTAGQYQLIVRHKEGVVSSSIQMTAVQPGMRWWSWGGGRPDAIDLSWGKEGYQIGEVAELLVKAPFSGTLLLSIEGVNVKQQRTLMMRDNIETVMVPITAEMLPHVRCSVAVVRAAKPEEAWESHRAAGSIGLPLMMPTRELAVNCEAAETVQPGRMFDFKVKVNDSNGEPVVGRVVVAAVDEGILRMTGFAWQSPLAWFLAPRMVKISGYDLFSQLLPERESDKSGKVSHAAGDEAVELAALGQLSPVRGKRFKPVALWSGVVNSDSNGVAEVGFELPEFAGTLRLMVLAYDRERSGNAVTQVVVKRPFVLTTGLPRFLAPGDTCTLSAEVFNESGDEGEVTVTVKHEGPLGLHGDPVATMKLAAGGSGRAEWPIKGADGIGVAEVTMEVKAGDFEFSETTELPVRPASGRIMRSVMGSLGADETVALTVPDKLVPETVNWRLVLSGRQEVELAGAVQELLDYPYGCLEQTISRALPLIYLPDITHQALPGKISTEEVKMLINHALGRVLSMRGSDGLFTMWGVNGWSEGWEWGTIYAGQFLSEAYRAGYYVPYTELSATRAAVERILNNVVSSNDTNDPHWRREMNLKAEAAAMLSLGGKVPSGWLDRLFEVHRLLSTDAMAQVAQACARSGHTRRARTVLEFLGVPGRETRQGLNSEARTLALALLAWCEIDPESPVANEVVRRLNGLRIGGGWYTTQDNALAVMALGRYAKLTNKETRPFDARIEIAGDSRSCSENERLVLNGKAMPDEGVTIVNDGPGKCFYSLTAEGVPLALDDEREVAQGLVVRRTLLNEDGKVIESGKLSLGDSVIIKLTLTSHTAEENLIVTDLLPAGLEVESTDIGKREAQSYWAKISEEQGVCWDWLEHREVRDDRVVLFSGWVPGNASKCFYYRVRAVTAGSYIWPAVCAEAMYVPEMRASSGLGRLVIE
ncbi:MAG: hypothetical protein GX230_09825 [Lentisphaerae bacterium]|nr:hypothetical protein [Lentisphaerota bacterium]